jgi:hypothetical protein
MANRSLCCVWCEQTLPGAKELVIRALVAVLFGRYAWARDAERPQRRAIATASWVLLNLWKGGFQYAIVLWLGVAVKVGSAASVFVMAFTISHTKYLLCQDNSALGCATQPERGQWCARAFVQQCICVVDGGWLAGASGRLLGLRWAGARVRETAASGEHGGMLLHESRLLARVLRVNTAWVPVCASRLLALRLLVNTARVPVWTHGPLLIFRRPFFAGGPTQ